MLNPINLAYDCAVCVGGPGFKFPSISGPGLPNLAFAGLSASLGGLNYILPYIPPKPKKLPKLPSFSLFLDPFQANLKIPPFYLSGKVPFQFKANYALKYKYRFDATGMFKLAWAVVRTIFEIFIKLTLSVIRLAVKIPGVKLMIDIFKKIAISLGIWTVELAKFAGCFFKIVYNFIRSAIPV